MTKVGYGNLTVNERRQWEESGRFREKCVTSLLYDPLISDGRSGSRCPVPSNQAHQWTDRCEPIRFGRGCRRRATSHKDVVTCRAVQQLRLSAA